jgi:hypothetical protein
MMEGEGMRIFYSFLFFVTFNPIHCYWFYCGYKGSIDEVRLIVRFQIIGFVLFVFYVFSSITVLANWNGWVRASYLLGHD